MSSRGYRGLRSRGPGLGPATKRPTSAVIGRNVRKTDAKSGKTRTGARRLRPCQSPANPRNSSVKRARLKIVVSPVRVRVSPLPKRLHSAAFCGAFRWFRWCVEFDCGPRGQAARGWQTASRRHEQGDVRVRRRQRANLCLARKEQSCEATGLQHGDHPAGDRGRPAFPSGRHGRDRCRLAGQIGRNCSRINPLASRFRAMSSIGTCYECRLARRYSR
jgi:hypothetical protein